MKLPSLQLSQWFFVQSMEISILWTWILINYHRLFPVVHFACPCGRESNLGLQVRVEGEEKKFRNHCILGSLVTLFFLLMKVILVLPLKMGRVNAPCSACSRVALHSSRASCPIPRWTSQTRQPWPKVPGRQQKNSHPFQWIFGSKKVICQPAESMCCSRKRDLISTADPTRAKLLFEVRRPFCEGGLG